MLHAKLVDLGEQQHRNNIQVKLSEETRRLLEKKILESSPQLFKDKGTRGLAVVVCCKDGSFLTTMIVYCM